MTGLRRIGYSLAGFLVSALCAGAPTPRPAVVISYERVLESLPVDRASVVFLSDDFIAVLLHGKQSSTPGSKVAILRRAGGKLELVASTSVPDGGALYALSGERLTVAALHQKFVYSRDLSQKQEVPFKVLCESFPRVGVIGSCEADKWQAFRVGPPLTLLREGSGELISLSDGTLVYRLSNEVRTETIDGRGLGTIPVSPGSRYSHIAELAGKDRLFLTSADGFRIVDFSGREMLRIHPPEGWGFRHGWSEDGSRLLFDHFTVTLPWAEKTFDRVFNSVFGRLGVINEEPNGEVVRVIDARSGGICVNIESPGKLFGPAGDYHADLSPNGNWVAVSTLSEVSIYALPAACTGQ